MKNRYLLVVTKVVFLFTLIFVVSVPVTAAKTITVGSGQTYTTIQAAVDEAGSGDTIMVEDGNYNENVTVNKQLIIKSENGYENTIIEVADSLLDGFKITANSVTIEGFTIYGANSSGKAGILLLNVSNCSVSHNRCGFKVGNDLYDNYYGIALLGVTASMVDDNICNYDDWYGIWVASLSSNNTVSNNSCSASFVSGIFVDADTNTVLSNTCSDHHICGICIVGTGNIIDSNTCIGNGDGITLRGENGIVKNNLSSQNSLSGIYCDQIESYSIYDNVCSSNQNGILVKDSNDNLIVLNDFDSSSSSNVVSTASINSWESPLEIWYGYDRGTRNPPYVRSRMGNYYSDHGYSDSGEDGICDTAYALPNTEPKDDFPLFEAVANYGKDVNCDWDAEITSSEDLLVLGALTIVGSLEIAGKLAIGGI